MSNVVQAAARRASMFAGSLYAALVLTLAIAGCGGGVGARAVAFAVPPTQLSIPIFRIVVPAKAPAAIRRATYVGAGTLSVTIGLESVDGQAPPAGLVTRATSNIASGSCSGGCTISGPAVPAGTDTFSVTTFDARDAGGHALARTITAQTFAVSAGVDNGPFSITLSGIPMAFSLGAVANGTAAAVSSSRLSIAVLDADGNTITGNYAVPVTLNDSDTSGDLVQGTSLTAGSGAAATSVTLASAADAATVTFAYGGLAIAAPALTLRAAGATTLSHTFGVTLAPVAVSRTEIDLYAASGAGSTGTFTVSEAGWSDAPYDRSFALGTPTCSVGSAAATFSLATTDDRTWTDTMPSNPHAGTCSVPLVDFAGSGHWAGVTLTATTGSFTVN